MSSANYPFDDESDEAYRNRMIDFIREGDLKAAQNIDRLNFIEYAAMTAMREGRYLDDYLPEDDPLRLQTPERFQRMGQAIQEAAETGKPLNECLESMLKPGEPRWF